MIDLTSVSEANLLESITWTGVVALFIWKIGAPITKMLLDLLREKVFKKVSTTKSCFSDSEISKLIKTANLFSDAEVITRIEELEKVTANDYTHEFGFLRTDINAINLKVDNIDDKVSGIDKRLVVVETKVEDLRKH